MGTVLHYVHSRTTWTNNERRLIWWLICHARSRLNLPLDPVVATAFVILQRYFRAGFTVDCELFHLIIAALLTACKAAGMTPQITTIFPVIAHICKTVPSQLIRALFSADQMSQEVTERDINAVLRAENCLLRVIDFDYSIEIPFHYLNRWKETILLDYPEIVDCNWTIVIIDVCLMICSEYYLDVPPEVTAAVSACRVPELCELMGKVRDRYGVEVWDLAIKAIEAERSQTVGVAKPMSQGGRGIVVK
jgi:hypothetical protein